MNIMQWRCLLWFNNEEIDPPPQQDLQYVLYHNGGIKQQSDMDRRINNDVETGRETIQPKGSAEINSITV